MATFGQRVKELREVEKKMTQSKMGEILGVQPQTISGWELDTRFPDKENLIEVADFFEVSLDYLLGRSDVRGRLITDEELKTFLPHELVDKRKIRFWIHVLDEEIKREIKATLIRKGYM